MYSFFPEVKGHFGFGCMRLPMRGDEVDTEQFAEMIAAYLDAGFNYFDTAHGYLDGKSETAIRACLTSRYPRDRYILADKLTEDFFSSEAEIRPFFDSQLRLCGVEYFDFYLMHAQGRGIYEHFKRCRAYETALQLKAEGKIRHFGISFHDTAEILEQILTEYPQIEFVQIQLNYVDYDDPAVQSRRLTEVLKKHNKPAIVMEPVKGGSLVRLPEEAAKIYDALGTGSYASYALRFALGCPQVAMVLSGMSDPAQMRDNLACMADFRPLDEAERDAVRQVCAVFRTLDIIPCTACRYCTAGCPQQIAIPNLFACMNAKKVFNDWNQDYYYAMVHTGPGRRASDCIECGQCEQACPQHLPVRELLKSVAAMFEQNAGPDA